MERWKVLLIGAAFLVAMGLAGTADREEAERQRAQYCEMVELWHESGGDAGWPPYEGECNDE